MVANVSVENKQYMFTVLHYYIHHYWISVSLTYSFHLSVLWKETQEKFLTFISYLSTLIQLHRLLWKTHRGVTQWWVLCPANTGHVFYPSLQWESGGGVREEERTRMVLGLCRCENRQTPGCMSFQVHLLWALWKRSLKHLLPWFYSLWNRTIDDTIESIKSSQGKVSDQCLRDSKPSIKTG